MTPPSSSSKPGIQFHHLRRLKQDPHLSGSSIRNLVKHFTTSMNPDPSPALNPNSAVQGTVLDASQAHKSTHRQPHKRQVRRRLHTARPYQDRLLNLAEARKEIVTALKSHRANSLKRQQDKHYDGAIMSPSNPRIYQSCTNYNFSNLVDHFSFPSLSHPPLSLPNYPLNSPTASSPSLAPPQLPQNLSFNLPNRTLGLNLNLQNFDNLDASLYLNNNNPSFYSYSSPSSSSSPRFLCQWIRKFRLLQYHRERERVLRRMLLTL